MPKPEPVPVHRKLPANFRLVRLELAREPGHPSGSASHGYKIVLPLDANDRIDVETWRNHRDACRVVRFRPNEDDEVGHLIHRRGGSWAFHYDVDGADADEAGYHFEHERFMIGEYVSVREDDGLHTYRVVSVEHI